MVDVVDEAIAFVGACETESYVKAIEEIAAMVLFASYFCGVALISELLASFPTLCIQFAGGGHLC